MELTEKWTTERVWEWYRQIPWIRGYSGLPSNCVNGIALWQEYGHEAVFKRLEQEFRIARETGLNAVSVCVEFAVWDAQHDSFFRNLEDYLALAHRHGLWVMLTLGNDRTAIRSEAVSFGKQTPDSGYYSGMQSRQSAWDLAEKETLLFDDPDLLARYVQMVTELAARYGQDPRLLLWNVWDGIWNFRSVGQILPVVEQSFAILRKQGVCQPLTASVRFPQTEADDTAQNRVLALSDVIAFHCYDSYLRAVPLFARLKQYHRPLFCTEWLNRCAGNDVEHLLPLFWLEKIGSFHEGLMQGFLQTYQPIADSYVRAFTETDFPFTRWQHPLYRFNGLPYEPKEIEVFRRFAGLSDDLSKLTRTP